MEDRLESEHTEPHGAALIALAAILVITAAWWALALWPTDAHQPEWLVRTRAACFGSRPGGLPDAGGWILLVGEPLGMLAMLFAGWRRSLRRDLRWITSRPARRFGALGIAGLMLAATSLAGLHVTRAWAATRSDGVTIRNAPQRIDRAAPAISLVDQHGRRTALVDLVGRKVLLTFAYGHCSTVCPSVVNDLRMVRREAKRPDVLLVVITLDPWRDTPERLLTLAQNWGLGADDRILSGSITDVEKALDALGIARQRNATTGDVDHATTVMIIDERGRIAWRLDGGSTELADLI